MNGSAIPAWIQQVLPKWFVDRPAFTEAAWAGSVSFFYATAPILGAVYGIAQAQGQAGSLSQFLGFVGANWFGIVMGYFFGGGVAGIRATQAATKATAAQPQNGPSNVN